MTRLFRTKSVGLGCTTTTCSNINNPNPILRLTLPDHRLSLYLDNDQDEEEDEEEEEAIDYEGYYVNENKNRAGGDAGTTAFGRRRNQNQSHQFPIVAILVAALRKSMVICSVEKEDVMSMDISSPTNVRHVSHVTFDRFNGFLGLPVELEPEVPCKVPSASASVFGVSANSMQCSFDRRGNSVPIILLMMQNRLYSEGGLQAEGVFRINPENSQEEYVRDQLNRGVVPRGIDVHCLAGLIKAWFRELPSGVLDSLTPEQVMHCNTVDECTQLVMFLPPTEAALLDWAINLMADIVHHEHHNKMNARNIAMVFAPNMTQMADPLTALIHAVQVMNFLKTLIVKTLREREESHAPIQLLSSSANSPYKKTCHPYSLNCKKMLSGRQSSDDCLYGGMESEKRENILSFNIRTDDVTEFESASNRNSPVMWKRRYDNGEEEGIIDKLSLRKGVLKLCRHPVFQLSKPVKKSGGIGIGIVNSRGGSREAWA